MLALDVGFSIPVLVVAYWWSSAGVGGTCVTCMTLMVGCCESDDLSALLFRVLESRHFRLDGPPLAAEHMAPLSLFALGFLRGISNDESN